MRIPREQRRLLLAVASAIILCLTNAFTLTTSRSHSRLTSSWRHLIPLYATLMEDEEIDGPNGGSLDDKKSHHHQGYISPYHILYPDSFADAPGPLKRSLPLCSCLRLLRKTLEMIVADEESAPAESSVLRIEHTISHTVDPLCWLQAQSRRIQSHPSLYFATAEGTLEAAAFGSVHTHRGTFDDEAFWNLVQDLPPSTYLYGGQRFDVQSDIAEEWKEFSQGLWMLPAIEVRRQSKGENDFDGCRSNVFSATIAIHLRKDENGSFLDSASHVREILSRVTDATTAAIPPTTLPPVLSRASTYGPNLDGQEIYERGVTAALEEFARPGSTLKKVVLARRMDLTFSRHALNNMNALDILRRWKFASKPGGHMFYINPGGNNGGEFFGCTPERLFRVNNGTVLSEALAGTRPRGSTQQADEELSQQLFSSAKDQAENMITGDFILKGFQEIQKRGWAEVEPNSESYVAMRGHFFVRRLRHLQHICQRFQCHLSHSDKTTDVIKYLLTWLHPTPAVGGFPKAEAAEFIRNFETTGFDRGFYAGPVGFVGKDAAEITVAIRSGLLSRADGRPKVSVYAGAGIVPGSTAQGEWAETSYKLAVVSSIFPQSPITLQSYPTPNSAWASAFVEELIRNGITQFYICPGSRSTPLVAAIAKAVRSNVGLVQAMSVHDERGAGFRALGYGRGAGQPAAVITSSGTAIANLYPAIMEAGMDGVPLLVLTADRPYESRDTGANQAIDQVKAFSSSYVRWFRDILPPNDDVPVAVGLADAAHAVAMSRQLRGPVHMNIQFRENLAPDGGPIRNDDRPGSETQYDALRFTEAPGFQRWSLGGEQWLRSSSVSEYGDSVLSTAITDLGRLVMQSKRGIIVVGNLRKPSGESGTEDISQTVKLLSSFAQSIGFPIFASVQSGNLRFESPAVIPFAEHLLRSPLVQDNLQPDLVLQFGAPIMSVEIPKMIKQRMSEDPIDYVIIHPHHSHERADPDFTVTHKVNAEIGPFVSALMTYMEEVSKSSCSSDLAPLVSLGRKLQAEMPSIVRQAIVRMRKDESDFNEMTEPEIFLAMSRILSDDVTPQLSLFLSNSMPVRDAEAFLYPLSPTDAEKEKNPTLMDTGVNRGASGIDGVIASAAGFADSTHRPTTLVIGDVAALHDINSLHALRAGMTPNDAQAQRKNPLTTIVLNNDGGGIFSFLPISKHGNDVSFEEFFGTPTNTFSFQKGAEAFGLPYRRVEDADSFPQIYRKAMASGEPSIIEAVVAPRNRNVAVHREITKGANEFMKAFVNTGVRTAGMEITPIKQYGGTRAPNADRILVSDNQKTLLLLHGWMGDKCEWDDVGARLVKSLPDDWSIISVDLPGHGESELRYSADIQAVRNTLGLNHGQGSNAPSDLGIDQMASSVYRTLRQSGVNSIDAIAGYSLGGRVALAMKRMSLVSSSCENSTEPELISDETKMVLVSAFPGDVVGIQGQIAESVQPTGRERLLKDDKLSDKMIGISNRAVLMAESDEEKALQWSTFLQAWYGAPLWGSLKDQSALYRMMVERRSRALSERGRDFAAVLKQCSPPRCSSSDWRAAVAENTLFMFGGLDHKYSSIGNVWASVAPSLAFREIPEKGHALLAEAPEEVAEAVSKFVLATKKDRGRLNERTAKQLEASSTSNSTSPSRISSSKVVQQAAGVAKRIKIWEANPFMESIGSLDFESFTIDLVDDRSKNQGVFGIGWGENAKVREQTSVKQRKGFIIQIMSSNGARVGLGEVSPLSGLHPESLNDAEDQLNRIAGKISDSDPAIVPSFDASKLLTLSGDVEVYLDSLTEILGLEKLLLSVRSGLEMSLLSLASQVARVPIHKALVEFSPTLFEPTLARQGLRLNGLITRGNAPTQVSFDQLGASEFQRNYNSWKVKIGHQDIHDDVVAISCAFQIVQSNDNGAMNIRADANRGFNDSAAIEFVEALQEIDDVAFRRLEYIEEPLEKVLTDKIWSLESQVNGLERWYRKSLIPYALDESLSDLAKIHDNDFDAMLQDLRNILPHTKGCAAFVLKPSLLGLELSMRLARMARQEFGIGAVFTSSFDSGVGLAYASFLASLSDGTPAKEGTQLYAHGLGTFYILKEDCLSPSFGSYVNLNGLLNVASLSRAFYGLGLNEIQSLHAAPPQLSSWDTARVEPDQATDSEPSLVPDDFEASTETSSSGREISVFVSLPLPFSAEIACARFTDLPQQPRWSPWISSVAYIDAGSETEWTLRVRGVSFRWRATSSLLEVPYKGIRWESVSGLKNTGVVEFVPTDETSCVMKVRIVFVTPRILASLFRGTFFEEFLRNKILKWSLEMFRDVVKGDLALEQGNVELGDALFGSVEGKANAIEATLSNPTDRD